MNIITLAPVVLVSVQGIFNIIVADFSSFPCMEYSSEWISLCVSRASGKIRVRFKKIRKSEKYSQNILYSMRMSKMYAH